MPRISASREWEEIRPCGVLVNACRADRAEGKQGEERNPVSC